VIESFPPNGRSARRRNRQLAFVHAGTGSDDIKTKAYGYKRDSVSSPTAGQNIGYADHNQHPTGTIRTSCSRRMDAAAEPDRVDAVIHAKLMVARAAAVLRDQPMSVL